MCFFSIDPLFGFLMLKYAFSHILDTLFLLFLTSILTPKCSVHPQTLFALKAGNAKLNGIVV